jgi:hypothetical protein
VHAVLHERFALAKKLTREDHHRRRAVANLGVLRTGDVHQALRRGVDDVQELVEKGGEGRGRRRTPGSEVRFLRGERSTVYSSRRGEREEKKNPSTVRNRVEPAPDEKRDVKSNARALDGGPRARDLRVVRGVARGWLGRVRPAPS